MEKYQRKQDKGSYTHTHTAKTGRRIIHTHTERERESKQDEGSYKHTHTHTHREKTGRRITPRKSDGTDSKVIKKDRHGKKGQNHRKS